MTGATSSLIERLNRRAEGDASIAAAFFAMPLVPLPALVAASGGALSHLGLAAGLGLLGGLVAATPMFALPPFVLGCGIGTLLHLALTAPERFAALERERPTHLRGRALIGRSLLVGGVFAATGLVAYIVLVGVR